MPLFLSLLLLLSSFSPLPAAGAPRTSEADALLAFKAAITADPAGLLSDWNLSGKPHCLWHGVTCSGPYGRIVSLNLTGAGAGGPLAGSLPPAIGDLAALRVLSIPHAAIRGEIPVSIERLESLEILEIQGNRLSGRIPEGIGGLPALRRVNLSRNSLSSAVPPGLIGLPGLQSLDLSHNLLSGKIRVNSLGSCRSLMHLRLSSNYLIDKIPPAIGICSNLRSLMIDGNIIEGRIPSEIGLLKELRVLDVSRNSLVDRIPRELSNCSKLSVLVLTNLVGYGSFVGGQAANPRGEFNAFVGGVPWEVMSIPSLEVVWAPRANLVGRLPKNWSEFCRLRVLNLAQNYISGVIPKSLGMCRNLSFLDLSMNSLRGSIPSSLQAPCMVYLNVSSNSLSGQMPEFSYGRCDPSVNLFENGILDDLYNVITPLVSSAWSNSLFGSVLDEDFVVLHDFSRNHLISPLPVFSLGDGISLASHKLASYVLLLNDNQFNELLPDKLFTGCSSSWAFAVNLSANQISGDINSNLVLSCLQLKVFEAACNKLSGPIPPTLGDLPMLLHLDLRGNGLNGRIPAGLGKLRDVKWILLGKNKLTGEIPSQLGGLEFLTVLDLSSNLLTGKIPVSLANASKLEVIFLDHNGLSGEVPSSFSTLARLSKLDVSFNNLSGRIPPLKIVADCTFFRGNSFNPQCPNWDSAPPANLPIPLRIWKRRGRHTKLKSSFIAVIIVALVVFFILISLILVLLFGRKKLVRLTSLRRKVLVTFTDAPAELNYDTVVRATGNFSIRNLIGTGGFGATYKAELVPGYLVAVKRLSIGRFQGLQQFETEIRTLGRIRHKNLVTLIGYHMGGAETFLIYNYLSGGNLETFIHERSEKNTSWRVIHKIALDVANALAYLHYSCVPRIVHRDIKPSNILLDEELNAYLSDFGLARLLEVSETHATTDVAGTFGYVAPEYATTCRVSDKSDVYSFGVVLLELMSGKRSLDPSFAEFGNGFNIVAWGKKLIMEGRSSELFSLALWEMGPKDSLIGILKLALACTVETLSIRPTMQQVVEKLKQL